MFRKAPPKPKGYGRKHFFEKAILEATKTDFLGPTETGLTSQDCRMDNMKGVIMSQEDLFGKYTEKL